jgi:hypothetical protein
MTRYPELISELIRLLESIRKRPGMYMGEISVQTAMTYMFGWRMAACVCFSGEFAVHEVQAERGWPVTAQHPSHHMLQRGWTPAQIVDELLVIEIESLRRLLPANQP